MCLASVYLVQNVVYGRSSTQACTGLFKRAACDPHNNRSTWVWHHRRCDLCSPLKLSALSLCSCCGLHLNMEQLHYTTVNIDAATVTKMFHRCTEAF